MRVRDLVKLRDITVIQEMLNDLADLPEEKQLEFIDKLRAAVDRADGLLDEQISIVLKISPEKAHSLSEDFWKSSIRILTRR